MDWSPGDVRYELNEEDVSEILAAEDRLKEETERAVRKASLLTSEQENPKSDEISKKTVDLVQSG